ncbi:MAG: DJ-1/PfpI family protein [Duodenibacillus sp.]|nr:DJ-1/PfpI family protein [Duodenibacillus sp.]
MDIFCLAFDRYEALDYMGPVEILDRMPGARLRYASAAGGPVASRQGFVIATEPLGDIPPGSALLVPGGPGTRGLVSDAAFLARLGAWADQAEAVLCVCTGSALLAAAGRLDGLEATSNKRAFDWVRGVRPAVRWKAVARWVRSGRFYTSSGVSAGMDMALAFAADRCGEDCAQRIADQIEYSRERDCNGDRFARLYGLG